MRLLSVITPVYNGAAYLRRCHATLAAQTFQDWEWVVVDDGSTDGTVDLVRAIDDERIRLLSYRPNKGRGHARHAALEAARGDWMVAWDADDMYFPDRLERIAQARAEGYDFFCSYAVVVDNHLGLKGVRGFHPSRHGLPRHFVHHTLGCRLELARCIGYDPRFRTGEDATITWALNTGYRGFFFEDALTVYQEEREVGLEKALATNSAQIAQLSDARVRGLLALRPGQYLRLAAGLRAKRLALRVMSLAPALYRLTISVRSYGETAPGYSLPQWRLDYLESLRERYAAG
jgi:glycosyltransferase involved in cell wall biosynthesis